MLNDKIKNANSLLVGLQTFGLVLILVSTCFYIGLNNFNFNHNTYTLNEVEHYEFRNESVLIESILVDILDTELGIYKDFVQVSKPKEKTHPSSTKHTHKLHVKSSKRLKTQMKIKDPVFFTPPTGLSSSFKKLQKPKVEIKKPVMMKQGHVPVLGVSKPYALNKSLSTINYNNLIVNSFYTNDFITAHVN